jgi:carbon storage regulator
MLVLSRRPGEEVVIASDIRVTVLAVHANSVKLGFSAPDDVAIMRSELVPRAEGDTEQTRPPRRSVG